MKMKPHKIYCTEIDVAGKGDFPIDMLRYDACCPKTENDSHEIERQDYTTTRVITLRRFAKNTMCATHARWQSFGWRVVAERVIGIGE